MLSGYPLVFAGHQLGSEISYEIIGEGGWPNSKLYKVTFIVYYSCTGFIVNQIPIKINPVDFPERVTRILEKDSIVELEYNFLNCSIRPPSICYKKAYFSDTISIREALLPYDIACRQCCRDPAIDNILYPDSFGLINHVEIIDLAYGLENDSPVFTDSKFLSFCVNEEITFDYNITEVDGDQLVYKFCTPLGYDRRLPDPGFLWPAVQYLLPTYATNYPLGQGGLFINSATGQLTGTPATVGNFAVGICVEEYRDGAYLGTVRQDITVSVVPCTPYLSATLQAETTDPQDHAVYQLCNENTLTLNQVSEPPELIFDYQWYIDYPGQPLISTEENPTFTFDQPGVFYGHLVVNPDSTCNDTAFFVVEVSDLDADFLLAYDTCEVGPVAFTSTTAASATIENYRWDFGDSLVTIEANPTHQYLDAGIYSVQLIVEDEYQCLDTLRQNLTWRPAPEVIVVSPDVAAGCTPLTTTIQNRSRPVDTTYQLYWEFGDGNTATGLTPSHTYRRSGNYNVYLSITSPLGCFVDTVFEDLIFADLPPRAHFSWMPSADPEQFAQLQFLDASERALGWNWIFDTLSVPDIRREPSYIFPDTGYHDVVLMVEDQYGCFDTLTQRVDVIPPQTYFLPNAFTPNGDGLNDEFIGVGLMDYLLDFRMDIFDRWGGLVFSSQDARRGWDGGNAPAGVYVYRASYRVPRGERTEVRGEVVLVR